MTTTSKKFKAKTNGVSTGKDKTKISVRIPSDDDAGLTAHEAKELLCGRRLEVTLKQDDEQLTLTGMEAEELTAIADVKSYTTKPSGISITLIFEDNEVHIDQLSTFQFTDVEIEANLVGPSEGDEDDEDDEDDE